MLRRSGLLRSRPVESRFGAPTPPRNPFTPPAFSAPAISALPHSPIFEAIHKHAPASTAVVHSLSARAFSYASLLRHISLAKRRLLRDTGKDESEMAGARVAFMVENGYDYVVTLLAVLASNAIAVPLAPAFPPRELRYLLDHSEPCILLSSARYAKQAKEVLKEGLKMTLPFAQVDKLLPLADSAKPPQLLPTPHFAAGGLMLYTSGTTARPKGVLLSHSTLVAQCHSLLEAWEYSPNDHLLHLLPLHHIHGTVNALLAPILAGSTIEFMFPFNVDNVWKRLATPFLDTNAHTTTQSTKPITFFTAVPTIWARMLHSYPTLSPDIQNAASQAIQRKHLRLNISGSAALPKPTRDAWTRLSAGNLLLERFGMTEVGMALSCGLHDSDRVDGSVGWPLPFVDARLVDSDTDHVIPLGEETDQEGRERQGEIQLRGPTVFKEYWRNPDATAKDFTPDGWFRTGDIAVRKSVPGAGQGKSGTWARGPAYFILGRQSADIIKTGGEKVSALEVERELLSLPHVSDCAVVALPSSPCGHKVAAVVVLTPLGETAGQGGRAWGAMDLRRALKHRLAAYKIPQVLKIVLAIPRNAMGKVNKRQLVPLVWGHELGMSRRSVDLAAETAAGRKVGGL